MSTNQEKTATVLDPALPIIDAHHHVMDLPKDGSYLFADLLKDVTSGHNIRATVSVEFGDMFTAEGNPDFRFLGETQFINGIASMFASGKYGPTRACAGIVGFANLALGKRVEPLLDAQIAAGGGRLRGIRLSGQWHETFLPPPLKARQDKLGLKNMQHLLLDPGFREGLTCLTARGLSYDVGLYYFQIPDLVALAKAFPNSTIIGGNMLMPIGLGPFSDKRKEVFQEWRAQLKTLSGLQNVFVKISGFRWAKIDVPGHPARDGGDYDVQPSSSEFAKAWQPYIDSCVEALGVNQCMFASNHPPDKSVCSYFDTWNAYKEATRGYSAAEREALFFGTAAKAYRLADVVAAVKT